MLLQRKRVVNFLRDKRYAGMILPLMQSKCDPGCFDLFFTSRCVLLSVSFVFANRCARFVFLRGLAARNLRSSFGEEVEAGELTRVLA